MVTSVIVKENHENIAIKHILGKSMAICYLPKTSDPTPGGSGFPKTHNLLRISGLNFIDNTCNK